VAWQIVADFNFKVTFRVTYEKSPSEKPPRGPSNWQVLVALVVGLIAGGGAWHASLLAVVICFIGLLVAHARPEWRAMMVTVVLGVVANLITRLLVG